MLKPSKNTFDCKLNKSFYDALNTPIKLKKKTELTAAELAAIYLENEEFIQKHLDEFREMYADDQASGWREDNYYEGSSMSCCGIDELNFQDIVHKVTKNTKEVRHMAAMHVNRMNNKDKRVLIVGLPLSKVGGGSSEYEFKNYKVLRKILLGFGFKQTTKKPYKNANSNNMLSVLVGQF